MPNNFQRKCYTFESISRIRRAPIKLAQLYFTQNQCKKSKINTCVYFTQIMCNRVELEYIYANG